MPPEIDDFGILGINVFKWCEQKEVGEEVEDVL